MKWISVVVLCIAVTACTDNKTEELKEVTVTSVPIELPQDVAKQLQDSQEIIKQKKIKDIDCLALNVYHESRSDNLAGQFAVADVVLNRVRNRRWPNSICDVVHQGPVSSWWLTHHERKVPIKNRCQFSWYCDGKDDTPNNVQAWQKALTVASQIYNQNLYRGITEGATHYHATYVNPSWNKRLQSVGRIGEHLFYRAE
jgi:spore germination cell wall hydrolase CwlJ-like protein